MFKNLINILFLYWSLNIEDLTGLFLAPPPKFLEKKRTIYLIIEGQNYNNLILTLNTELNKLDVWLQANKLTLNTDKTHYMVFHRARIKSKTGKISIRNNAIDEVKSTKFLGVIINDKLKWTEHIYNILKTKYLNLLGF